MRRVGLWIGFVIVGCSGRATDDGVGDGTTAEPTVGGADDDETGEDDSVAEFSGDCAELSADGPTIGPGEPGPTGFPIAGCNPRNQGGGDNGYVCCSDDPAAEGGALPSYQSKGIAGATPYFSGSNNGLGTSGMCVRTSDIPAGTGLVEAAASGCPIPCNPTWGDAEIAEVCGANRQCCQTRELKPEDCVLDEVSGLWRPVTGEDIGRKDENGGNVTTWAPTEHATHQDPSGVGCNQIAGGNLNSGVFQDCVRQLSVADQRGYCLALAFDQLCPLHPAGNLDACEQINMGMIPPPR